MDTEGDGDEQQQPPLQSHPHDQSSTTLPVTVLHHDGERLTTRQVLSLDNLKDFLRHHSSAPMDDPQERGDLYLLAPMRLLSPIVEESEPATTTVGAPEDVEQNYYEFNRSILTVISEMLGSASAAAAAEGGSHRHPPPPPPPMQQSLFRPMSADSQSSLVNTIEELRNNSLCNLFFSNSSYSDLGGHTESQQPAPQVPPRTSSSSSIKLEESNVVDSSKYLNVNLAGGGKKVLPQQLLPDCNVSVKSIKSNTLILSPQKDEDGQQPPPPPRRKKSLLSSPLMTSAGSRKNILQLAEGTTNDILNTPNKSAASDSVTKLSLPPRSETLDLSTSLHPATPPINATVSGLRSTSAALSPSSKYETPTPPLRLNQFVRNSQLNKARRKFSIIRERFESGGEEESGGDDDDNEEQQQQQQQPRVYRKGPPKIAAELDLYQNISDSDLLNCDLSHISGSVPVAPPPPVSSATSTPSFMDSKDFELRPDEKYDVRMRSRKGWATSSSRFQENRRSFNVEGPRNNDPNRR
jgi:hypothetical protein